MHDLYKTDLPAIASPGGGTQTGIVEMTPPQRWLALLDGRAPDWIATDYQATAEVTSRLMSELGCEDEESLWRKLHIDARRFLPDLIDKVGIEILNPIQWRCAGMEREDLVRDFGRRIIFHGSIDNQQTLPFGTPADVADEVRRSAPIYADARWICGPCHNIQPVSPTQNIVALYETIHENGGPA